MYDKDGNEIHIEVKTKSGKFNNNVDFYLTKNELDKLGPNHFIYYVCNLNFSNKIKIIRITKEHISENIIEPVVYRIKASAKLDEGFKS